MFSLQFLRSSQPFMKSFAFIAVMASLKITPSSSVVIFSAFAFDNRPFVSVSRSLATSLTSRVLTPRRMFSRSVRSSSAPVIFFAVIFSITAAIRRSASGISMPSPLIRSIRSLLSVNRRAYSSPRKSLSCSSLMEANSSSFSMIVS